MSEVYVELRCARCKMQLSKKQELLSYGRCPYCGKKGEYITGRVDVTEHPYTLKRNQRPWYHILIGKAIVDRVYINEV